MLTRGHFIGAVVDRLSEVGYQAKSRSALGLTDLNRYAEIFFRDLLNCIYGYSLTNANIERCNAPGIDLIDRQRRLGIQVTATKTSDKINETLRVAQGLAEKPDKILILIIGQKQSSYDGLDQDLCRLTNFSKANILDMDDLCKGAMDLEIDRVAATHSLVEANTRQLKIELETPRADGSFPTSALEYFERVSKPTLSDCTIYHNYLVDRSKKKRTKYDLSLTESTENVDDLISRLRRLPRVTREVLSWLIEHRDRREDSAECGCITYAYVTKMSRWDGLQDDLRLLNHEGLASYNEPDYDGEIATLTIRLGGNSDYFWEEFTDFIETNQIGYLNPLIHLDFSTFGPAPSK